MVIDPIPSTLLWYCIQRYQSQKKKKQQKCGKRAAGDGCVIFGIIHPCNISPSQGAKFELVQQYCSIRV